MASGLYSHPGVPLEEHSNQVLDLARRLSNGALPTWWRDPPRLNLLEMAIALHDFGKATDYFQAVLRKERGKDAFSRHARLSALFFLNRATAWLGADADSHWLPLLFAYVAVLRHHTQLQDMYDELCAPDNAEREVLEAQIRAIPPDKANIYLTALDLPEDQRAVLSFDANAFLCWLQNEAPALFRTLRRRWRQWKKKANDAEVYFAFLSGFSVLLDADKLEAGVRAHLPQRVDLPSDAVDRYKARAFGSPPQEGLNSMRERAYQEVLAGPLSPKEHLYTLTLPTGMGKTLTGLAAALKLRQMIYHAMGRAPRIIYALPFLSIIDQNANTLEQVLQTALGQVDSRTLVKHHHLADVQYWEKVGEEVQEFDYAASRLLTEGWHTEILITTFVQLFDTLVAWRNGPARRVNKLHGSILLLDEVQALPTVYWPLMRRLLTEATERLGAYVILMTATQPYLLESARELVPNHHAYFDALDRMDVVISLKPQTLENFVFSFQPEEGKSHLFITNTIASAQQLHEMITKALGEKVVFLSTGVTPKERLKRIEDLKAGRYRFAVSTQLIEAGVDIDFDIVYRDLAPLDSLVQAAGRCNRHLKPGHRGQFHIVHWVDEQTRSFAHLIYDPVLLDRTQKHLKSHACLREPEFLALLGNYFQDIWKTGIAWDVANALWEAIRTLRFDGQKDKPCILCSRDAAGAYLSQFCLIEQQPYKRDVFVQVDEEAVAVWNAAKAILHADSGDIWEMREAFARLKSRFFQYVISVALKPETVPGWDDDLRIYVVSKDLLEYYYDKATGFKRSAQESSLAWMG